VEKWWNTYHPKVKGSNPGNDPATESEKYFLELAKSKFQPKI
jgi:hypothetical protein